MQHGRSFADEVLEEMSKSHNVVRAESGLQIDPDSQNQEPDYDINGSLTGTLPKKKMVKAHPLLESIEALHKKHEQRLTVIKLPKSLVPNGQAFLRILPQDLKSKK